MLDETYGRLIVHITKNITVDYIHEKSCECVGSAEKPAQQQVFRPNRFEPTVLMQRSDSYHLEIQRRDELVHLGAITFKPMTRIVYLSSPCNPMSLLVPDKLVKLHAGWGSGSGVNGVVSYTAILSPPLQSCDTSPEHFMKHSSRGLCSRTL